MEKAAQTKNTTLGILSWLKRHGSLLLFILATLLVISATWFALYQKPHRDAFRVTPSWFSSDFWLYPIERNAFKRLPVIQSNLNDVIAIGDKVWAVGDGGLIIYSNDGGKTWQQQFVNQTPSTEPRSQWNWFKEAWAGMEKTDPSGTNQTTPSTSGLTTDVQQENVNQINKQQTENSTTNQQYQELQGDAQVNSQVNGELQSKTEKKFDNDLNSIFFVDDQHGWAVGSGGMIVHSDDGGISWRVQTSNTTTALKSVMFTDAQRGWVVGIRGMLLSTSDGGKSWQDQSSGTFAWLFGVTFIDTQHGWAVGRDFPILVTRNGGASWHTQANGTRQQLNNITFIDGQRGWAVGMFGKIFATTDGGSSWQEQVSGTHAYLTSIKFVDGQRGWVTGSGGAILSTSDGGLSWQLQASGANTQLSSIMFIDKQRGWVVGRGGTILLTTDGGKNWQPQVSGTHAYLTSIKFVDGQRGWVAGDRGTFLATSDGGTNWQAQVGIKGSIFTSVTFIDGQRGWIADNRGKILASTDGGQSWQENEYYRYPAPWFYVALLLLLLLYVAAFWARTRQTRLENQQQAAQSIANLGVTDKPAGPGQADLIGARQIALGLTRFLTNENTRPPLTIAITGEWGSGKSSIMNYLFANLNREGLRRVWFNAWHHREEQNVLASMLANIHQQAIRPWWHPAGIWFRLRML